MHLKSLSSKLRELIGEKTTRLRKTPGARKGKEDRVFRGFAEFEV